MALLLNLLIRLAVITIAIAIPVLLIRTYRRLRAETRAAAFDSAPIVRIQAPRHSRAPLHTQATHDNMRPGLDRARLHAQFAEITAELADIDDLH